MNKFIERLNELLKESEKTQTQISKDLGITKQKLSQWKTGYINPNIDELINLAIYFDTTIDYIVGYDNENSKQKFQEELEIQNIRYKRR